MTNTESRIQKATKALTMIKKKDEGLWFNAEEIFGREEVTHNRKQFSYVLISRVAEDGKRRVVFATKDGKAIYNLTKGQRLFATKKYLEDYLDFHSELYHKISDWYNDTLLPAVAFIEEHKEEQAEETKEEKKGGEVDSSSKIELEESDVDVETEDYAEKLQERFIQFDGIGKKRSEILTKAVIEKKASSFEDLCSIEGMGEKTLQALKNVNIKNLIA